MFKKSPIKNTILQKYVMEEENRVNDNFRLLYRGGYVRKICTNYRANQKNITD